MGDENFNEDFGIYFESKFFFMATLMIVGSKSADYKPVSGELANISHLLFGASGRRYFEMSFCDLFAYFVPIMFTIL